MDGKNIESGVIKALALLDAHDQDNSSLRDWLRVNAPFSRWRDECIRADVFIMGWPEMQVRAEVNDRSFMNVYRLDVDRMVEEVSKVLQEELFVLAKKQIKGED